jgi:threonylcarbamoyladenosine tRNA methylthiotransferase MtaB
LNAFESEVMRRHAAVAGLEDVVIINSCAVTAEAVRQARQAVRRARREKPGARIIVTGCAAQTEPETFAALPEVDHVIGNSAKLEARTYRALEVPGFARLAVDDIASVRETASHLLDGFGEKARAYVRVQNGCDHGCTFCIIPFGRGPSRSVPAGEVVAQVRRLVETGYREVVLTGVDLTAYGKDLPGEMTLGRLVRKVLKLVPDLKRLRISSIDSVEACEHLLAAVAEEERLMPHLHLSLQSGDDLILKRMKRRHSRADAVRFCEQVMRLRPGIALGADLIAGFPTETEAMFQGSLKLPEDCGLTFLHVFPFSARPGTPAARMPQIAKLEVKERARRLRTVGVDALSRHLASQMGRVHEILVEQPGLGRTQHFTEIAFGSTGTPGDIRRVRVTGHDQRRLTGEVLP